jgi:catechol-2,3-dioxygenase
MGGHHGTVESKSIMKIKELHLGAYDLHEIKGFYHGVLGLPIESFSAQEIIFSLPDSRLGFYLNKTDEAPQYHIAFNIPHNQVREASHWLANKVEMIPLDVDHYIADFQSWNAEAVYFFDESGNILEFIGRRDVKNASQQPFGHGSILSISEIGLVTDDVNTTCKQLMEQYELTYFSKQPPQPDFAAIGDDEGLFIVVSSNRNWYPTHIPSSRHNFSLTFVHNGKETNFDLT